MVAAMVLVVRAQSGEPEWTQLAGRTSRGDIVHLTFMDSALRWFSTGASGWCPLERQWASWNWSGAEGPGRFFERDGHSFHVREAGANGRGRMRVTWVAGMRGELSDDKRSATGTVYTRWSTARASCEGRIRFRARRNS